MGSTVLSYILHHLPPVNTTITYTILTPRDGDKNEEKTPILRHECTANKRELSIYQRSFSFSETDVVSGGGEFIPTCVICIMVYIPFYCSGIYYVHFFFWASSIVVLLLK